MGRQKREFTAAEQAALKKNPYTYRVYKTSIRFTTAFKETFMQQYEAGMSPTKIVEEMGYDAQVLGSRRVNSLYRNFQQQRVSSAA